MKVFVKITVLLGTFLPAASLACDANQKSGLEAVGGSCGTSDLTRSVNNNIVNALFTVAGAIAVIIIVIGGIRYITSTGDASRIKAAKDTILYAVIGLIVVILARSIVGFVGGTF